MACLPTYTRKNGIFSVSTQSSWYQIGPPVEEWHILKCAETL